MQTLHCILNMPEYAFRELWIVLGSKYDRILNVQELYRVVYIWHNENTLMGREYTWICLNLW